MSRMHARISSRAWSYRIHSGYQQRRADPSRGTAPPQVHNRCSLQSWINRPDLGFPGRTLRLIPHGWRGVLGSGCMNMFCGNAPDIREMFSPFSEPQLSYRPPGCLRWDSYLAPLWEILLAKFLRPLQWRELFRAPASSQSLRMEESTLSSKSNLGAHFVFLLALGWM